MRSFLSIFFRGIGSVKINQKNLFTKRLFGKKIAIPIGARLKF